MAFIFILLTQIINLTTFTIDFQVPDGERLLPVLPPSKTRFVKQSRLLRQLRKTYGTYWKIRVLIQGNFTGIELDPRVVLWYVRVVFRVDGDVLCVIGVRENHSSDIILRHRYFGCMRNHFWDRRGVESIDRSDSVLSTKLRNLEGDFHNSVPFAEKERERHREVLIMPTKGKSNQHEKLMKGYQPAVMNGVEEGRPRREGFPQRSSVENESEDMKDSFVYGLLFAMALIAMCIIKLILGSMIKHILGI